MVARTDLVRGGRLSLGHCARLGMHREWGEWMRGLNHQGAWYYRRLVWTDICNKILPLSEPKANEQALARKGKKDSLYYSLYDSLYLYLYL